MNSRNKIESDAGLGKTLQAWEVKAELPPHFKEEVWRRIGRREQQRGRWWPALKAWIGLLPGQPVWAGAYVAVLVAAGIWAGLASAKHYRVDMERTWQAAYVESVSPIVQAQLTAR